MNQCPVASSRGICPLPLFALTQPASCTDNIKNGYETDVDCGGKTCPKCDLGKKCTAPTDCLSNNCKNNICVLQVRGATGGVW